MPKETPIELEQAIDRLLDALDSVSDLGADAAGQVSEALHECAAIARELGLTPEELLLALKPRLERMAARAPAESREGYLRAITELAIDSFLRGP
jgi:hypothetical protein